MKEHSDTSSGVHSRAALKVIPMDAQAKGEVERLLTSLVQGQGIAFVESQGGHLQKGVVDMAFPKFGLLWVLGELGERKLLDGAIHTFWSLDKPPMS